MARIYRLTRNLPTSQPIFFDRRELNLLLSLYSRRVMSGEWRDYAIDHKGGVAIFSVFRHALDAPIFSVAKKADGHRATFLVYSGGRRLKQASSLAEALSIFERRLSLVQ